MKRRVRLRDRDGGVAYRRVHVRIIPGGLLPEESRSFHKHGMIYNATGVEQILGGVSDYIDGKQEYQGTEFKMVEVGKGRFNFIGMSKIEAEAWAAAQAEAQADEDSNDDGSSAPGV